MPPPTMTTSPPGSPCPAAHHPHDLERVTLAHARGGVRMLRDNLAVDRDRDELRVDVEVAQETKGGRVSPSISRGLPLTVICIV